MNISIESGFLFLDCLGGVLRLSYCICGAFAQTVVEIADIKNVRRLRIVLRANISCCTFH